jgi:hypothetical protein
MLEVGKICGAGPSVEADKNLFSHALNVNAPKTPKASNSIEFYKNKGRLASGRVRERERKPKMRYQDGDTAATPVP